MTDIIIHNLQEQLDRIESKIDGHLKKDWLSTSDVKTETGFSSTLLCQNIASKLFQILYSSPRVAKKSFGRITTQKVQKHPDKTLRVSYTVPPRHLQSKVKALKPLKGVDNVS